MADASAECELRYDAADAFQAPVAPDYAQAVRFFDALYREHGALIHFRAVPEPARTGQDGKKEPPRNLHYLFDDNFADTLRGFLEWCAIDSRAAFFLPGVVTAGGTGKADVTQLPAVVVDFDKGDPADSLAKVEALLGPATIVVESGGKTEHGPKLHAYWKLDEPARGAAIETACRAREELAKQFGGDPAFKQAAQVIRIPGSVHFKNGAKLVTLRTVRDASYSLAEIAGKLGVSAAGSSAQPSPSGDYFNFNTAAPALPSNVERALTAPVHEGAVDDVTRFDAAGAAIGHFIRMAREGRYSVEEAWQAAKDWNQATLVPPWEEERLRNDFERLLRIDQKSKGPFIPPAIEVKASGGSIRNWKVSRFVGTPPARKWLVEGLIPLATPGVFAAVGDAGKSMMALNLALQVASAPTADPYFDTSSPRFFGCPVVARGAAVILTAEDDTGEVHRRLAALADDAVRASADLYVRPMLSDGGARAIIADGPAGPQPTPFWSELRADLSSIPDLRLIVLDPLSHFAAVKLDNDNQAASMLMAMVGALAEETGAAVMLVHHMGKNAMPTDLTDARGAIRGASALVDNGRWALAMWEATGEDVAQTLNALGEQDRSQQAGVVYRGGLAKGNAPGVKTLRTLRRHATTGLLEDVTDLVKAGTPKQAEVDAVVVAALKDAKFKDPRFSFTGGDKRFHEALCIALKGREVKVPRVKANDMFERLLDQGAIVAMEGRANGRPLYEPKI